MNEREENASGGEADGVEALSVRVERFATAYALSPKERQVLLHVAEGSHPKAIGDAVGCAYSSVRTLLRRIYKKTRCSGVRELTVRFFSERYPRSGVYPKG